MSNICAATIKEAHNRIEPQILRTPLVECDFLSTTDSRVFLKLENLQVSGAFKIRGAFNKLLQLQPGLHTVVTASTGNHGLAVATACQRLKLKAEVFVPEAADPVKLERIRTLGARLHTVGGDCLLAEQEARHYSQEESLPYISPYNDPDIINGQGTVAREILQEELPDLSKVFVSVGGGGLISGVGTYLKSEAPEVKVIACQPERARALYEMIREGGEPDYQESATLSESTAGAPEADSVTLPICRSVIDEFALVSEAKIADTMRLVLEQTGMVIEGAAALTVAAILTHQSLGRKGNIVGIICGRNISIDRFITQKCAFTL